MKHFFYPRLALSNIKKNAKIYLPYLLTSLFTVSMFYCLKSLSLNQGLNEDSSTATVVMQLGTYVVLIFSVIFLFYLNSFLMKRRKKEIALYNILGMEKKHVIIMMLCETLLTSFIAIIGGILVGIIFSQLMFLLLVNLSGIQTSMKFGISFATIYYTIIVYGCIFFASYLFNVIQIKLANPIELLRGGEVGEKEPKTKWLLTIFGMATLSAGYVIAQTIQDPISAMLLFFVAVILVIIGTYSLFTAGSIALLKLLKKNKHYYYQTRHFISVSQMIYRMKQNAVGLASICILCTCILVMISSTVTLYLGVEDTVQIMQDADYCIKVYEDIPSSKQINTLEQKIRQALATKDIKLKNFVPKVSYDTAISYQENQYVTGLGSDDNTYTSLSAMTLDEYNQTYNKHETLKDNEVLLSDNYKGLKDHFYLNDYHYSIKKVVQEPHFLTHSRSEYEQCISVVFKDEETLKNAVLNEYIVGMKDHLTISIDYQDGTDEKVAYEIMNKVVISEKTNHYNYESQYGNQVMFLQSYGSLFFLGLFLGVLFLMAAILIMYYKQLSEGYEDQKRYEIMQNVGMSRHEVKQTIKSQVLIFFFLPLVVAIIHMAFAYKMIVKMFGYLIMSGSHLFIICTVISIVVLIIIYSIIYSLTAKTYYKIVRAK